MKSIYLSNLKKEIKSIKAIIVSALFILVSFLIAKYSGSLSIFSDGNSPAIETLFGIYAFLGFLFSSILFSGIICREVETETLRYITPYLSRRKIYFTKFLVMMTYFLLIILVSLVTLFAIRGEIFLPIQDLVNIIIFFAYTESLVLLISTISNSERLASLLGIVFSIAFPIIFAFSYFKENILLKIVNWILPYKYLEDDWEILVLLLLSLILFVLGLTFFERKEI